MTSIVNSHNPTIAVDEDESVDLFFGPEPPDDGASNWIRTLPA